MSESDELKAIVSDLQSDVDRLQAALAQTEIDGESVEAPQDLREKFEPGDEVELVVEDLGENTRHGDAMGRVDGAVAFLVNSPDDIALGDRVTGTVTAVQQRHLRAVSEGDQNA